jgi:hypothetical protein
MSFSCLVTAERDVVWLHRNYDLSYSHSARSLVYELCDLHGDEDLDCGLLGYENLLKMQFS